LGQRIDGHEVSISAFAMSQYKTTNGEYLEFVHAGPLFEAITLSEEKD
jgi:formylglycine-generating enzyme required for sulfatase activity